MKSTVNCVKIENKTGFPNDEDRQQLIAQALHKLADWRFKVDQNN